LEALAATFRSLRGRPPSDLRASTTPPRAFATPWTSLADTADAPASGAAPHFPLASGRDDGRV